MCPALLRFLAWPRRDEGAYPQRSVTEEQRRPGQKSEATLRARALWAVWRRCSLLTDRCGYARRSRLAIQPKALSRGAHGYFNRLLKLIARRAAPAPITKQGRTRRQETDTGRLRHTDQEIVLHLR